MLIGCCAGALGRSTGLEARRQGVGGEGPGLECRRQGAGNAEVTGWRDLGVGTRSLSLASLSSCWSER